MYDIEESNLKNWSSEGETVTNSIFKKCIMTNANFKNAKLINVKFIECDLSHADFYGVELKSVEFVRCNIPASIAGITHNFKVIGETWYLVSNGK